ncbi:MAG: POTRA domain-containing protein, partial [Cyclobacteriaceae bacterium]
MYRFLKKITVLFLLPLILSSCLGTRYLDEGEYLLREQEIKSSGPLDQGDLEDFYRQETNSTIPLIRVAPFVLIYQLGLDFYDKEKLQQKRDEITEEYDAKIAEAEQEKKIARLEEKKEKKINKVDRKLEEGNLLMRWGEPLAVYDSSLAETTQQQMENYIRTKGYFNGVVNHETELNGRKLTSIYTIEEQEPYLVDTITYNTQNEVIQRLITENLEERHIEEGDIYDQDKLSEERVRIETLLKNNGFFDFSRQYVVYRVDSTISEKKVAINTVIQEPAERGYHKQFRIDSVIFVTDSDLRDTQGMGKRKSSVYNNIIYRYYEYEYYKKILDRRIFIHPDSL